MSKVKICTLANKEPEFIYRQYETIKKFVKDEKCEFIVFDNTPINAFARRKEIKRICKELGIKRIGIRFKPYFKGAARYCAYAINWMYHRFFRWEKDTIHVILDSDMVFINDFNFNEFLADNDICAVHQQRGAIEYLWNGVVIMKGGELPDKNYFNYGLGTIEGERTDGGGNMYFWMKRNPNLKIKYITHTGSSNIAEKGILSEEFSKDYKTEYGFQIIENSILHYRAGSNWNKKSPEFVQEKKNYFNKLIDSILSNKQEIKHVPEAYVIWDR